MSRVVDFHTQCR